MRTLNLVQFARETGGVTDHDVQSHIHAGLRSAPRTSSYRMWFAKTLTELGAKRDATREAYRAAVAAGEIAEPAKPTLEEIAMGDGEAAAAARRLLAKRATKLVVTPHKSSAGDT